MLPSIPLRLFPSHSQICITSYENWGTKIDWNCVQNVEKVVDMLYATSAERPRAVQCTLYLLRAQSQILSSWEWDTNPFSTLKLELEQQHTRHQHQDTNDSKIQLLALVENQKITNQIDILGVKLIVVDQGNSLLCKKKKHRQSCYHAVYVFSLQVRILYCCTRRGDHVVGLGSPIIQLDLMLD